MKTVRIYIDFKSGPAYLAMQPTLALLQRRGVSAEWLPFDSRVPVAPPARVDESRGETHLRVRQEQRQATCLKYAVIQGVPMRYPPDPGSTLCALAALLYVQPEPLSFIEAAFAAYWRDNLNLDDAGIVARLLHDGGYDADAFTATDYEAALDANQRDAEERGVFDTPMFILGEQMFLGREQLPWIESLL
jgi:2-hydroxychromene-2-carboxylate isomerase